MKPPSLRLTYAPGIGELITDPDAPAAPAWSLHRLTQTKTPLLYTRQFG